MIHDEIDVDSDFVLLTLADHAFEVLEATGTGYNLVGDGRVAIVPAVRVVCFRLGDRGDLNGSVTNGTEE